MNDRIQRYVQIAEFFRQYDQFTIAEVMAHFQSVPQGLVTRLANELVEDKYLTMDGKGKTRAYRWQHSPSEFDATAWAMRKVIGPQITQTPIEERPRERLLRLGAEKLRMAELLAILIRSGVPKQSALQMGEQIANRFVDDVVNLRTLSKQEMKEICPNLSEPAYCQIMAGIELGRRLAEAMDDANEEPEKIDSVPAAITYCSKHFRRLASDRLQEELHIVTLDTKLHPIGRHQITVGTLDASLVAPREVFRPAIRDAAKAILLVHNHPSGDPTPSRQDFQATDSLEAAGKIIGIEVVDHIIVASGGCTSIRESR